MIGQISASNQLQTSSELAPNMFGASSELASVMGFGFKVDSKQDICVGPFTEQLSDKALRYGTFPVPLSDRK